MNISNEALSAKEAEQALPDAKFVFDRLREALVVIDPQNDFLSPEGAGWPVFGRSVTENNTVANLGILFEAAESRRHDRRCLAAIRVFSRRGVAIRGPAEELLNALHMFKRSGPLTVEGLPGSGADFLERFKQFIFNGSTNHRLATQDIWPTDQRFGAAATKARGIADRPRWDGRKPLRGVPSASSSGGGLRGRGRSRCDRRTTARRRRRVRCGCNKLPIPRPRRLDDRRDSLAPSRRRLTPGRGKRGSAEREPAAARGGSFPTASD